LLLLLSLLLLLFDVASFGCTLTVEPQPQSVVVVVDAAVLIAQVPSALLTVELSASAISIVSLRVPWRCPIRKALSQQIQGRHQTVPPQLSGKFKPLPPGVYID
jgi:hypothetical protein